jgi:hypothetical protein
MRTVNLVGLTLLWIIVGAHGMDVAADSPSQTDLRPDHFHADNYLRLAAELQALGRDTAVAHLHEMAKDERTGGSVIILCRMLFKKRADDDFRRPHIGGANFLGGTGYSDWPLEPIELVDGIPFLIVTGYTVAGFPELDSWYLTYVEAHADWNDVQYLVRTKQQQQAALAKLLFSPKWKTPLTDRERQFLARQLD